MPANSIELVRIQKLGHRNILLCLLCNVLAVLFGVDLCLHDTSPVQASRLSLVYRGEARRELSLDLQNGTCIVHSLAFYS